MVIQKLNQPKYYLHQTQKYSKLILQFHVRSTCLEIVLKQNVQRVRTSLKSSSENVVVSLNMYIKNGGN